LINVLPFEPAQPSVEAGDGQQHGHYVSPAAGRRRCLIRVLHGTQNLRPEDNGPVVFVQATLRVTFFFLASRWGLMITVP
jgi:hypothetical protein